MRTLKENAPTRRIFCACGCQRERDLGCLQQRKKISLVILDLIIPEMDGHQCLNKIFRIDPQARVIVSSGYSANCSQEKMSESGVKGFVGKPYDIGRTSFFHNMIRSL
jgi:response regulator RpfG family c-di-GMP phosphodiesterase